MTYEVKMSPGTSESREDARATGWSPEEPMGDSKSTPLWHLPTAMSLGLLFFFFHRVPLVPAVSLAPLAHL